MIEPRAADAPPRVAADVFGTRVPGVAYHARPSAYAIVTDRVGRVAVMRTPLGAFLPGGGAEPGETPEATIEREGVEEAGLRLRAERIVAHAVELVYAEGAAHGWEKRSTFLQARAFDTAPSSEADHELVWLPLPAAHDALTPASHRWSLSQWAESVHAG